MPWFLLFKKINILLYIKRKMAGVSAVMRRPTARRLLSVSCVCVHVFHALRRCCCCRECALTMTCFLAARWRSNHDLPFTTIMMFATSTRCICRHIHKCLYISTFSVCYCQQLWWFSPATTTTTTIFGGTPYRLQRDLNRGSTTSVIPSDTCRERKIWLFCFLWGCFQSF